MHANKQTLLIICILFSWEILQTYTFLPGKSLPFPTDRKHQSLRTQSAEPESTGFYTVLHHMQPSLRLINTSAANSAHSVTGLHVHALPYSWHCSHYGPNQYNQGSCQDILHRIDSLFDMMQMPNSKYPNFRRFNWICESIKSSVSDPQPHKTPHQWKMLHLDRKFLMTNVSQ